MSTAPSRRFPRRRRPASAAIVMLATSTLVACSAPRVPTRPIRNESVLACVKRERERATPTGLLTLGDATKRMRRHNPVVQSARADWRAARALADVPTPLPNPTIAAVPLFFQGKDILAGNNQWGAAGALGWTAILAGKRALNDDLNRIRAGEAFAMTAATEREQYLGLRWDFMDVTLESQLLRARRELADTARASQEATRKAVEAGATTILDVQLIGLETANFEAEVVEGEEAAQQASGRLGARMGVVAQGPNAPRPDLLPSLPPSLPEVDTLGRTAVRDHPDLTRLRATYVVAEKELRLEAARAWPDLDFGFAVDDEPEERIFGLPLAIEIPIFNRNQQGIASACARRDAIRTQFEAEVNRILADIENVHARVQTRRRRYELLGRQVAAAQVMHETAEQVQASGTLDMLRYLEVLRTSRRVQIDYLVARNTLYETWSDLEQACGAPLIRFEDEPGETPEEMN